MSCVTCGGEGSVRRDAAVYCTTCATRRDWGSILEAVQSPRGKNLPIEFDLPKDDSVSSSQPSVEKGSPVAVLHGETKQWDAGQGETLVDESMLEAIDELTKSLEDPPSAEEVRTQYVSTESDAAERDATDSALARVSHMDSSTDGSMQAPRYAAPEHVGVAGANDNGQKADPFG